MGLRGVLPNLKLRSEALTDLTAPDWLSADGKSYWMKHSGQLAENHLLTVQTSDAFAMLCDLYGRLMEFVGEGTSRTYLDTLKAFQNLSKNFRLLPTEKPLVKEERYADFSEVNFE